MSESDIERQLENWMQSPEHLANILRAGLNRYGLGLAAEAGELYAVQNFSGPGTPRGVSEGETPEPLPPGELAALAADVVNDRRTRQDLAPLKVDEVLTQAARNLAPDDPDQFELEDVSLMDAIPRPPAGNGNSSFSSPAAAAAAASSRRTPMSATSSPGGSTTRNTAKRIAIAGSTNWGLRSSPTSRD